MRRLIINAAYLGRRHRVIHLATRTVKIVGDYQLLESGFNYYKCGVKPHPVTFYH